MDREEGTCLTPPTLALTSSFSSFPRRTEWPGMATPPIRLPGAIPFKWEEAPGRPREKLNQYAGSASAYDDADRTLGLPPRLSASASTKEESKAIIHRPCFLIRRRPSFPLGKAHLSFGKERKGKKVTWDVNTEKSSREDTSNSSASSSSFNSLSSGSVCSYPNDGGGSEGEEEESKENVDEGKVEERKVRILRYKKKGTFTCIASHSTASHFWASIFGRLKHAVVPSKTDTKV